jgi:hypothetical protein
MPIKWNIINKIIASEVMDLVIYSSYFLSLKGTVKVSKTQEFITFSRLLFILTEGKEWSFAYFLIVLITDQI